MNIFYFIACSIHCLLYLHIYFPLWHVRSAGCDTLSRFWQKLSLISFLHEIFRRWSALITPLYTPKIVQATSCFEISPIARKMQSFTRFWRKLSVSSFLYEIFRRLNGHFTLFHTPNVVQVALWRETSPAAGKMQSFTRF
jgi:hypothetical protein